MNPQDFGDKQIPPLTMTEAALSEIEARAKAATPGPWQAIRSVAVVFDSYGIEQDEQIFGDDATAIIYANLTGQVEKNDAEFIAAARSDIPALLNEIATLRRAVYHYATQAGRWHNKKGK